MLRSLSKLTDKAIGDALRSAKVGMSEMELAGNLLTALFAGGAESYKLMIIASGERSQFPNVGPTEQKLKGGDIIRMEIFGQKNGYLTGVCRTAVVGEPTAEQEKIWANLIECKYLVMDLIKPGASCPEIYRKFLKKFSELGFEPISFVAHGIGLHLHEEPYMGRYGDEVVEAGMVGAFEPLVYIPGRFGMQNKDMFCVTEKRLRVAFRRDADGHAIESWLSSMKITKIETMPIRLPTRRVHQWASLTTPIGVYVIIKLHTDEGLIGLGEAPVLKDWGGDHGKYFGETPQTTMHIIKDILAPALTGQDPSRFESIHALMDKAVKGYPYARRLSTRRFTMSSGKALKVQRINCSAACFASAFRIAHSLGSDGNRKGRRGSGASKVGRRQDDQAQSAVSIRNGTSSWSSRFAKPSGRI